jgi:hypothetical protein
MASFIDFISWFKININENAHNINYFLFSTILEKFSEGRKTNFFKKKSYVLEKILSL